MDDVVLGPGNLAGRGGYAARDFAAGDVVVSYRLQPLDEADYSALPAGRRAILIEADEQHCQQAACWLAVTRQHR